ncbi:carbohydrate binding [Blomia tropicalis]|nr:carbohydrate binding [Blomia tropicalis]
MNFDALFFAREDWQEQSHRRKNRTLEHVWQASSDLGKSADLFTGMMNFGYGPPQGFNWDLVGGADEPVIDDPESDEYNVPRRVKELIDLAKTYQKYYATNNVMFPMGTDFQYQDAHIYFKNMDKLIKYVNENSTEVNIFYSTPSCYAKSLKDSGKTFTAKNDDYFPYASDPHSYWTGYFTSRPAIKRFERVGNNYLQVCKQMDTYTGHQATRDRHTTKLREIMGVMQHHDAVSGTEKQHVAFNYAKHLQSGIESCRKVISEAYQLLQHPHTKTVQTFCDYLNISSCAITESGQNFVVNIYNPLSKTLKNHPIRLPINSDKYYNVVDDEGKSVYSELTFIPEYVQAIPERTTNATTDLVFLASIPPLGYASYFVQATTTKSPDSANAVTVTKITNETRLSSGNFSVVFDSTGALSKVELPSGESIPFKNEFRYYNGAADNIRASGAYIFRPKEQQTFPFAKLVSANLLTRTSSGGIVHEVHQKFDSNVEQVIRVLPDSDSIEFEYVVGPIPVKDGIGKEVVLTYETDFKNNKTFYTDANGRQMMKRKWDYRPEFKMEVTEPISGNYYPINSRIYLQDEKKGMQMTILNDRSQGGTSPRDGVIEIMVHRRLLHDDGFGVGEALNEPGVDNKGLIIRGRHLVQFSDIKTAASKHRPKAQQLFMAPVLSFVPDVSDYETYKRSHLTKYSALINPLPEQIHLLTLERWMEGHFLLRLEHYFQTNEDAELSKPVTLNLKHMFKSFKIFEAEELTLGGNQPIFETKHRMKFNYIPVENVTEPPEHSFDPTKLEVKLYPMQIRTFSVRVIY